MTGLNLATAPPAPDDDAREVLELYTAARSRRAPWEPFWQECYDFALPLGHTVTRPQMAADRRGDRLFDGTAVDAVDQLAASLLSELTPPWSRWFGLAPGPDLPASERDGLTPLFERVTTITRAHFDRSNFAIEMHQCFLDLVTVGTATLLLEENPPGEPSALRFTAVPLADAVLEEGPTGRLDVTYRRSELTYADLRRRFPTGRIPEQIQAESARRPDRRYGVLEAVLPDGPAYRYEVVLEDAGAGPATITSGRFGQSPFISFRWLKAPGESYGRSPVMKALPDIKTANKVLQVHF